MGVGHGHTTGTPPEVEIGRRARTVLLGFLAVVAVLAIVGMARWWPDPAAVDEVAARVDFTAPGVSLEDAVVLEILPACGVVVEAEPGGPPPGSPLPSTPDDPCGLVLAEVASGPDQGDQVQVQVATEVTAAGLAPGDTVSLLRVPGVEGAEAAYSFNGVDRTTPVLVLLALFVLVVVVVARLRGFLALVGLVLGGAVLIRFMLPALLTGEPAIGVAVSGSAAIMFLVLYLAHGVSLRTSTALAGTLLGVAVAAVLAVLAIRAARLSGVSDDTSALLTAYVGDLDFQGLLVCATIVAGLGVLNDVTITQASAVWELRAAAPGMGRRELFARGMRIGRDHIASTIYTIVFAYTGAALSVLLLLYLYNRPVWDVIMTEAISTEVIGTLASAIGLVLSVPITTGIATLVVGPPVPAGRAA